MIYISNTGHPLVISIPRSFHSLNGQIYHFEIRQAGKVFYSTNTADLGGSWLFYNLEINLPEDLVAGEYEYILRSKEGDVLSTGLAEVVWERPETKSYETRVEYEQYEA